MVKTKLFSTFLLVVILSACAALGDRKVNVTEAQIQEKLNEKLAIPVSLLKIFDVNLSNSIVSFDQTTGRIHTTMDTNLSSAILDKALVGKLAISGKLRFDEASNSVVLDEPKVENFNFDGATGQHTNLINALAKAMGGEVLNGLTLYKLQPGDLKVGTTQYNPKDIQVTDQGLQLTLTPN